MMIVGLQCITLGLMVRPESSSRPAGGSRVRVGARVPGSRPQQEGRPLWLSGASQVSWGRSTRGGAEGRRQEEGPGLWSRRGLRRLQDLAAFPARGHRRRPRPHRPAHARGWPDGRAPRQEEVADDDSGGERGAPSRSRQPTVHGYGAERRRYVSAQICREQLCSPESR